VRGPGKLQSIRRHLDCSADDPGDVAAKHWETQMATFIVLSHFTDQGIRDVKDSPKRAAAFKAAAKKAGVTVKAFYWTLGKYDMISILEAPDIETITALGLSVGKLGNVRTETLPAFDNDGMGAILKNVV
jgi:uncharacterized protein with GYD domain